MRDPCPVDSHNGTDDYRMSIATVYLVLPLSLFVLYQERGDVPKIPISLVGRGHHSSRATGYGPRGIVRGMLLGAPKQKMRITQNQLVLITARLPERPPGHRPAGNVVTRSRVGEPMVPESCLTSWSRTRTKVWCLALFLCSLWFLLA